MRRRAALALLISGVLSDPASGVITIDTFFPPAATLQTTVRDFRVTALEDHDVLSAPDPTNFSQTVASSLGSPGQLLRATTTLTALVELDGDSAHVTASGSFDLLLEFENDADRQNMGTQSDANFRVGLCVDVPTSFSYSGSGRMDAPTSTHPFDGQRLHFFSGFVSSFFGVADDRPQMEAGIDTTGLDGRPLSQQDSDSRTGRLEPGCHELSVLIVGNLGAPLDLTHNPPAARGEFQLDLVLQPAGPDSNVVRWVGGSTGAFADATQWDPERVPGTGDSARFDRGRAVVDLAASGLAREGLVPRAPVSRTMDRLLVLIDPLQFTEESEIVLTSPSLDEPSLDVDGGRLELAQTVVRAQHAVISSDRPGEIEITGPAGALETALRLSIGRGAHGSLRLQGGGEATTGETLIGDGDEGVAAVIGADSSWTTHNIAVGHTSAGSLVVREGAQVFSDDAFVDFNVQPGTVLDVVADVAGAGPGGGAPALWECQSLEVGPLGRVIVGEGGVVRSTTDVLLGNGAQRGAIEVNGGRLEVLLDLLLGSNGPGRITATKGQVNVDGQLVVGTSVGFPGEGLLVLRNPTLQSDPLAVSDLVTVGTAFQSAGRIEILDGAGLLTSTTAEVGGALGRGAVLVDGGSWQIGSQLTLGSDAGPASGNAFLQLAGQGLVQVGTLSTPGNVVIGRSGLVSGAGTLRATNAITNNGTIDAIGGTIVLDARYTQGPDGALFLFSASPSPAPQLVASSPLGALAALRGVRARPPAAPPAGQIHVTGDADLAGTLVLQFYNGFAPGEGETFQPLLVDGVVAGDFGSVVARGISGGDFNHVLENGVLTLTSLSDAEPLPAVGLKAKRTLKEKAKKGAKVKFTRAGGDLSQPLLVSYGVGGTATEGIDYEALPGVLEIPARKKSATLVVRPFADGAVEATETIELSVVPSEAATPSLAASVSIELL